MNFLKFLQTAVSDYRVGAISRSSKYLVRSVIKRFPRNAQLVVEYGAGDGVVTLELLKLLKPSAQLVVVEANENFVERLRKINDPRLRIIHGTVEQVAAQPDLYAIRGAQAVISSIPFSFFSEQNRVEIVKNTHRLLAQGGTFIVFHQYSPLMRSVLKKFFPNVQLAFEPRNLFPCFLMSVCKN